MAYDDLPAADRISCSPLKPEEPGFLLDAFPTLTADRDGGDTVLSGELADQAALYGVLTQIESLGLELLAVQQVMAN